MEDNKKVNKKMNNKVDFKLDFKIEDEWKPWIKALLVVTMICEILLVFSKKKVDVDVFCGNNINLPLDLLKEEAVRKK